MRTKTIEFGSIQTPNGNVILSDSLQSTEMSYYFHTVELKNKISGLIDYVDSLINKCKGNSNVGSLQDYRNKLYQNFEEIKKTQDALIDEIINMLTALHQESKITAEQLDNYKTELTAQKKWGV